MSELLSPVGSKEAFYAAINGGADAVYLGLDKYSARAYAENFTLDNLGELVAYAHLRNVKVFVTINTIIYDFELEEVYKTIDKLAELKVDAIIVQDLAVLNYIANNYESLEAHASTQMGIDDIEAASLVKELGAKRIVFARETPLERIKEIKEKLNIEVEAFIHGALCVSYSGNCYMSSAIGERSGNRGRCAGCCRKYYSLVNLDTNFVLREGYLLSMKDLNVSNNIESMKFIDSFKIEGRMKEPNYVYSVTNVYRNLIDKNNVDVSDLNKVFNRTYTPGYISGATPENITNIEKPNNYGFEIGTVSKVYKNHLVLSLKDRLNKGDQIRIETSDIKTEISIPVTKIFNAKNEEVESAISEATILYNSYVPIGAKVYKTKDSLFVKEALSNLNSKCQKHVGIDVEFCGNIGKKAKLTFKYENLSISVESENLVEVAKSVPITKENVFNQISKLNDTPYKIHNASISLDNESFISLKVINDMRRQCVNRLNFEKTNSNVIRKEPQQISVPIFEINDSEVSIEVFSKEQFETAKQLGFKIVYFENKVSRNNATYPSISTEVLVNGLNGINHYRNECKIITDSSLNVVNYKSVAMLHNLGVERITLSQEINKESIKKLISNYIKEYSTNPNLELIVYGRSKIMHTKYCPLKRLGHCGECKKSKFALKDDYGYFPLMFNSDCTISIFNSNPLNIIDDINDLKGISCYRIVWTDETVEEIKEILETLKRAIKGEKTNSFIRNKHTHGHFINNPL